MRLIPRAFWWVAARARIRFIPRTAFGRFSSHIVFDGLIPRSLAFWMAKKPKAIAKSVLALGWDFNLATNHVFPMAGVAPTVSNYNATFSTRDYSVQIAALLALPEGRRSIRMQWVGNQMFRHPLDRVRNAAGNLADISVSPVSTSGLYQNATGNDGIASGWSGLVLDGFKAEGRAWATAAAAILAAGGATVDFLAFDTDWAVLDDAKGNSIVLSSLRMEEIVILPLWIRPKVTAGNGSTSLTVSLVMKGNLP